MKISSSGGCRNAVLVLMMKVDLKSFRVRVKEITCDTCEQEKGRSVAPGDERFPPLNVQQCFIVAQVICPFSGFAV